MEQPRWKDDQQLWHNRSVPLPALRRMRTTRGLTQRELGQLAGISPNTVLLIETGRRGAYSRTVRKLASALGVAPAALVRGHPRE